MGNNAGGPLRQKQKIVKSPELGMLTARNDGNQRTSSLNSRKVLPRVNIQVRRGGRVLATFDIELALSEEDAGLGLMYRYAIPPSHGMIIYNRETGPMNIWMKNTFIALDLIFVNIEWSIIDIIKETKPISTFLYRSQVSAIAVIELPTGAVKDSRIRVGDRVWRVPSKLTN